MTRTPLGPTISVIEVYGDVDDETLRAVRDRLAEAIRLGRTDVVLDLSRAGSIGACAPDIVRVHARMLRRNGAAVVVDQRAPSRRDEVAWPTSLRVAPSRREALAWVRGRRRDLARRLQGRGF